MNPSKLRIQTSISPLLTLLLALPILSTDIYLPSLQNMESYLDTSHYFVQLTLSAYFLIFGFVQLVYGSLSDRFGRRPMMIASLILYTVGSCICVLSSHILILIIGRLFQGLGAGSAVLVFAIIRDKYEGSQVIQQISYMSSIVALSPIIAPIIGGYTQTYLSWQWNFVFLLATSIFLFLTSTYRLPETNLYKNKNLISFKSLYRSYYVLITNKQYIRNAFGAAFAFGALFSYISGSHYILVDHLGYSPQVFGYLFAIPAIGYVFGAFIGGRLVPRYGVNGMIKVGMVNLVGGAFLMIFLDYCGIPEDIALLIPQILCEIGISILVPMVTTKALIPIPEMAGAGSAFIGFMRFLFATLASLLTMTFQGSFCLGIIILGFALGALISENLFSFQVEKAPVNT